MRTPAPLVALLPILLAFAQLALGLGPDDPLPGLPIDEDDAYTLLSQIPSPQCPSHSDDPLLTIPASIPATTSAQCHQHLPTIVPQTTLSLSSISPGVAQACHRCAASKDHPLWPVAEPVAISTSTVYATSYAYSCSSEAVASAIQTRNGCANGPPRWPNGTESTNGTGLTPMVQPTVSLYPPVAPTRSLMIPEGAPGYVSSCLSSSIDATTTLPSLTATAKEPQATTISNSGVRSLSSPLRVPLSLLLLGVLGIL
jgi:hypothetical protein